ncbi:MAG TPA: hypothetical protein VJC08_00830 [bacterium]|nr:hypothetical protein [bacterium]
MKGPVPPLSVFETSVLMRPFFRIFSGIKPETTGKIKSAGPWILAALLLSCIFIPRLSLRVGGTFRLDLRAEDFLLLVLIFLFFAAKAGKEKKISALVQKQEAENAVAFGSVENSFLLFFLAVAASLLNGLWERTLDKPIVSLFYVLKWAEYFMVFVVSAYFAADRKSGRFLLKFFFILGLALALYGYREIALPSEAVAYPNYYRLYERFPFFGDANHVSGLMVLWMAFFAGLYLKSRSPLRIFLLAAGLLLIFPPFLLTYSRKSYFALAIALAAGFLIKGSRRRLIALILCYVLIALILPSRVLERVSGLGSVLTSTDAYNSSWAHNVESWALALWNFGHFWLLGAGIGARHRIFYESQYLMVMAETGFVGLAAYLALVFSPLRSVLRGWPGSGASDEAQGVAWGWILGLAGLLIHAISCISGSIVKVAVPSWFLTGVVLAYLAAEKREGPSIPERLVHEPA